MFARPAVTAALLVAVATAASGQQVATRTWNLRLPTGGLIATGRQRDHVADAKLMAIQVSRSLGSALALTGTFGWARSNDVATIDTPKLDVFTSDVGVETCFDEWFNTGTVALGTFAGIGGGVRSYNYRHLDVDATNNLAGYVAAGGEIGIGRIALRLEARDYATGFRPLVGAGKFEARNDVVIMGALRFNRRSGESR
jgi:hypothetical protein